MEWIFDGIGTAIVTGIAGILIGGYKLYKKNKNEQSQKAGNRAIQIQQNNSPDSPIGDYVNGNKFTIVQTELEDNNVKNINRYSNSQIENFISQANNETLRKWGLELIINQKPDYLIELCLNKMDSNVSKYTLLKGLSERGFIDSEYFRRIANSITNSVYQMKVIKLCILKEKNDYIEQFIAQITNENYLYQTLIDVHKYDLHLFNKFYINGDCFSNPKYKEKMRGYLKSTK